MIVDQQARGWDFLTNHARVLLAAARDPTARIRDIGAACHITERTAQSIVGDLEQAGYLSREREGRRTRYILHLDGRLRHSTEAHLPVRALLELFTGGDREDLAPEGGSGPGKHAP
ncbi:DNA-binding MarR family transcriptional regulator [Streptomyces griseochromogenes]|uniref:DNA-binding MarR family transcriptional regulator n=1 Tax=Streptomyces griseochromogenes TaxID=68214 RepID=A0ABS4LVL2_9ACTN|nr:DNA-binding MarR family transcriptional regulator [Streptomyces griseochromogenes]